MPRGAEEAAGGGTRLSPGGWGTPPRGLTIHCAILRKGTEEPGMKQGESSGLLSLFPVRAGEMGEVDKE